MDAPKSKIENLDDFQGWGQETEDTDFFKELDNDGIINPSEDAIESQEEEQEEEEQEEEEEQGTKSKKKPSKQENFFEDLEEEEEEEEEEEDSQSTFNAVDYFRDNGLIDFEDEELEGKDPDEFIKDKFEETINSRIEELFEDLPDMVKQLNNFVLKGGDFNEFIKHVSSTPVRNITKGMDLDDEDNQETIVREMMSLDGNDEEIIDAQIEFLKDSGKLKMFAKGNYNKWEKDEAKRVEKFSKEQELRDKEVKENIKKAKAKMSSYLSERTEIGGVQLSKNDAKEIPSYVNDRNVKLQNGGYISQLQKELYYDLPQNEEAYLQLATLMKNRNKDGTFNFEAVYEKATTNVTQRVKNGMRRKDKLPSNKNTRQQSRRLADFFNN